VTQAGTALPGTLYSPAAQRNQAAILAALTHCVSGEAAWLEIASGSGQHAAHMASAHSGWTWQPSDANPQVLPAIAARCAALPAVLPPLLLNVCAPTWPVPRAAYDAIFCANMLHISAPATLDAMMSGAALHLRPSGQLFIYGPFRVAGEPLAPSNRAFDADLRARNPQWGLREVGLVQRTAQAHGLELIEQHAMPANNLLLRFGLAS
jgi:hypothetical protein